MRIAAVADDVTGATDLAGSWRSRGLRTAVVLGELSEQDHALLEAMDAVVFAVKIRSVRASDARAVARRIGSQLQEFEGVQVYYKYCSTFDSTAEGNIGPIADELAGMLGAGRAVVVPSMPANGRTVYQGTLFVHDRPLSESPMRDHPLNPMRDSDLVRLLQAQTARPVGLIPWQTVRQGPVALRRALDAAQAGGAFYLVVDAIENADLETINEATVDDVLVTGGSGLALGARRLASRPEPIRSIKGHRLILAGSASAATRAQVRIGAVAFPTRALDLERVGTDAAGLAEELTEWARERWAEDPSRPVMIHSDPASLGDAGPSREQAEGVEAIMARLARLAHDAGARQFLVAGGETSGAVIGELGIRHLELGDEIDPGVSWVYGIAGRGPEVSDPLEGNFLLKSGNFGNEHLFENAWEAL